MNLSSPLQIEPGQVSVGFVTLAVVGFFATFWARNLLFAGGLHWLFLIRNRERWRKNRIQPEFPNARQEWIDFWRSGYIIGIYSLTFGIGAILFQLGWTKIYLSIDEYGWPYFFASNVLVLLLHDTYFYWSHRLRHWGPVMKVAHREHHVTNPSPWTGFSMNTLEALIESLIFPAVFVAVPLHPLTIWIWLTLTNLQVAYAHLGYELYPQWFLRTWLGKAMTTSTMHNEHHRRAASRYALFFTFWDVLNHTDRIRSPYTSEEHR